MRWPALMLFTVVVAGSLVGMAYKRYADQVAALRDAVRVAATG